MNDGLERMWKGAVMAKVKVLAWHLAGGTAKHDENPQLGLLMLYQLKCT